MVSNAPNLSKIHVKLSALSNTPISQARLNFGGDKYVYEIREEFGRNIVREFPEIAKDGDIIMSVPETGDDSAMGVHENRVYVGNGHQDATDTSPNEPSFC